MALYQLNNYVYFRAIANYKMASEVMWKKMVLIQSLSGTSLLCSESEMFFKAVPSHITQLYFLGNQLRPIVRATTGPTVYSRI